MRRSGIFVIATSALVLLMGAGAVAASAMNGPDPAVKEWAGWAGEVSCGVPFDPLTAFAAPADAERGHLPSEVALRAYLKKTRHYFPPSKPHSWRLLVETPHYAQFGRGRLSSRGVEVNTFKHGANGWEWAGYSSGCQPTLLRNHQEAITWTLARGQRLTAKTRVLKVNLGPGECASGLSQDKRLERPEFRVENGALLMALWIRPVPPGAYTCVGLIEPPVTIRLPQPLGERELLDGGVFPPTSSAEQIRREEGI
jgi:hypothetical protein